MMNCPEVMELMNRFIDDDLNEIEISHLKEHLKQCSDCSEMFERLQHLSAELENLPKVMPKFSLVDAIMPQLDQLDMEKQQNAAVRETSSSSAVVPLKRRLRDRIPFRTLGGVVAAGFIVGLFLVSYKPDTLQQADMELSSVQESTDQSTVMNKTMDKANKSVADSSAPTQDAVTDTTAAAADPQNKADGVNETAQPGDQVKGQSEDQVKDPEEPSLKAADQDTPASVDSKPDSKSTPSDKGIASGQQGHKTGNGDKNHQVPPAKPNPKSGAGAPGQHSKPDVSSQEHSKVNPKDQIKEEPESSGEQSKQEHHDSQQDEIQGILPQERMGLTALGDIGFDTTLDDAHMEVRSEKKAFRAVFDEHMLVIYNGKKKVLYKQKLADGMVTNPAWSPDQETFTFEFASKNEDGSFGEPELVTITPQKSKS